MPHPRPNCKFQSCLIQNEPERPASFSHKMSLNQESRGHAGELLGADPDVAGRHRGGSVSSPRSHRALGLGGTSPANQVAAAPQQRQRVGRVQKRLGNPQAHRLGPNRRRPRRSLRPLLPPATVAELDKQARLFRDTAAAVGMQQAKQALMTGLRGRKSA